MFVDKTLGPLVPIVPTSLVLDQVRTSEIQCWNHSALTCEWMVYLESFSLCTRQFLFSYCPLISQKRKLLLCEWDISLWQISQTSWQIQETYASLCLTSSPSKHVLCLLLELALHTFMCLIWSLFLLRFRVFFNASFLIANGFSFLFFLFAILFGQSLKHISWKVMYPKLTHLH